MGQKSQVLVDTDILIKVFRGDAALRPLLEALNGRIAISVVTNLELLYGLKTKARIIQLNRQIKAYSVLHLNEAISKVAIDLGKKYTVEANIKLGDALIAATALYHQLPLFTDNRKDFDFIEKISFYEP